MKRRKHYLVIIAWAKGEDIQYLSRWEGRSTRTWSDWDKLDKHSMPNFTSDSYDWRVKPSERIFEMSPCSCKRRMAKTDVSSRKECHKYYEEKSNEDTN